jgi:hypothetical protein
MPNSLTLQQLKMPQAMIDRGDLKGFYDYMYGQGYGYANLAKGWWSVVPALAGHLLCSI